eukprot:gene9592-biopygen1299
MQSAITDIRNCGSHAIADGVGSREIAYTGCDGDCISLVAAFSGAGFFIWRRIRCPTDTFRLPKSAMVGVNRALLQSIDFDDARFWTRIWVDRKTLGSSGLRLY